MTWSEIGHHQVHVMLDHEDGDAALADAQQQLPELGRLLRVQAGGRLVEQQQLRLGGERAGQLDPALQAIGEAAGRLVRQVREADEVEQLQRTRARRGFLPRARRASASSEAKKPFFIRRVPAEQHVVEHGQVGEEAQVLEGAADAHARRSRAPACRRLLARGT